MHSGKRKLESETHCKVPPGIPPHTHPPTTPYHEGRELNFAPRRDEKEHIIYSHYQ